MTGEATKQLERAVGHDPCLPSDRVPRGAVRAGTPVKLLLRVDRALRYLVSSACVQVDEGEGYRNVALYANDEGYVGEVTLLCAPHVAFYRFALELSDGSSALYVPRGDGRATAGELVACEQDEAYAYPAFQITIFNPEFDSPAWAEGAVMYQIFPDRFARSSDGVSAAGLAYHEKMGRPLHLHKDWDEPVEWKGRVRKPKAGKGKRASIEEQMAAYDPIDFYGGSLAGIREKLPYLASLGVEVIYLNPVFEARSNHRYDTADYERIDPLLGDRAEFERLVAEAKVLGISILLDAVLSHTGADSRYFNKFESYAQPGAAQGSRSPFYQWFDFSPQGNGAHYRCWWGDPTLPEVNERDESWQRYVMGDADSGDSGLLGMWIEAGASGYRLDVADEIPDDVLERIRTSVKRADQRALIIGEVWEDPTTKVSYGAPRTYALGGALDSVMNYPLRDALIGFALERTDAYRLVTFLKLQQSNYPAPLYRCLMNLLSTHDVERIRSVLALGGEFKYLKRNKQHVAVSAITEQMDARACALQRIIVGLLYAVPGMPCIYYGDERGMQGGGDPFCRATFPWQEGRGDCGEDLTGFYRELGAYRKRSQALRRGLFACQALDSEVACIVRALPSEGEAVIVAANRSEEDGEFVIDMRRVLPEAANLFPKGLAKVEAPALSTTFDFVS